MFQTQRCTEDTILIKVVDDNKGCRVQNGKTEMRLDIETCFELVKSILSDIEYIIIMK